MGIFVTLFLVGLILSIVMIGLSFLGDFDMFGDIDADLDTDIDIDMDVDLDTDIDFDGDIDTDVDGAESHVGFSFLSPYMISFLFMGIGIGGTFLEESYNLEEPALYGGALAIGIVISLLMQKMFRAFFVNTQVNSMVKNKDFAGAIGIVTLRIPTGDIGEVAVSTRMGRLKLAARADEYLPEGTKVMIKEKLGNTLMVEAMGEVTSKEKTEASSQEKKSEVTDAQEEKEGKDEEGKDKEGKVTGEGEEESEFTFEAYRKKEEARKPTVIYDQRTITIKDSVINRSDFSELGGGEAEKERSPSELKKEMKKQIANELFKGEEEQEQET